MVHPADTSGNSISVLSKIAQNSWRRAMLRQCGSVISPADEELKMLNWPAEHLHVRGSSGEFGPGNALAITVEHEHITEVFTGLRREGVSAESVAKRAVDAARNYLASEAPVGRHLADQVLLPMALAEGGDFVTMPVTQHFESHVAIDYLRKRITDPGTLIQVHLIGCARFAFKEYESAKFSTAVTEIAAMRPEVVTASMKDRVCEVDCVVGTLEVVAAEASICLGSGRALTLEDLAAVAEGYWKGWQEHWERVRLKKEVE